MDLTKPTPNATPGSQGWTCVSCGNPSGDQILLSTPLRLLRCRECGLVSLRHRSQEFDDDLYEYYAKRLERPEAEVYRAVNTARQQQLLSWLGGRVSGRRLLDVGCGAGQLVRTANDRGWDAQGIDLSAPAIRVCERFGVPARKVDFFSSVLNPERFDVIVMSELIEHVPNPQSFLERAGQLLNRGGVLYLTTPNFSALSRHIMGADWFALDPQHISYFDPPAFEHLVRRVSLLRAEKIRTANVGPEAALYLVRRLRRSRSSASPPESDSTVSSRDRSGSLALRQRIASNRVLSGAKECVNMALGVTPLGDTLVALLKRV